MSKKKKYVKLGEKALSFFDPTTRLGLAKGEAVELELIHRQSRRIVRALKSGHLDYVDSDELDDFKIVSNTDKVVKEKEEAENPVEENTWKDEVEYEEKYLSRLRVAQLRELANDNEGAIDMTEAEIAEATKSELILALLEIEWEEE